VTGPEQDLSTDSFYISKGEVTNGEYRKFLESYQDHSKCHESEPAEKKAKGHVPEGWADSLDPRAPVTSVDWFDAWAYAHWSGGRLPSEVEWEKAAGWNPVTGKKSTYPWGEEFSAGHGGPSPSGAEAMAGGVLEWVSDWYVTYPGGKSDDIDFAKKRRVARGGIFLKEEEKEDAKVTRRFRFLPDRRDPHIGFRILKSTESAENKG
jgi:iron(II)-dependent oxidoreductase